jgi:hypothetical protein
MIAGINTGRTVSAIDEEIELLQTRDGLSVGALAVAVTW